jgi:CheY-like chemotaxis protein
LGAAATVGLEELARLSERLELALRDRGREPDTAPLVAEARDAVGAIKSTIIGLEAAPTLTVLHVEDNPLNARLVERALARRPGIGLLTATRGETALRLARDRQPGLILLDLNLPDMSGMEVLSRLRQNPETRDLTVVVVTAHEPARNSSRLRELGIHEYLPKPIDVRRLLEVLDEIEASMI